ncbi:2-dehydro-3-deoxygalactonokinase [Marivivens marinus]|uniref:2-dehydro-3-deoxygalactonokinase n=1 Tax=Marivivens marinus TaxID=3110173 RepID=UPI003B847790
MSVEWVAVDWGTTNLRAWMIAADGRIIARQTAALGVSSVQKGQFEHTLLDLIGDRLESDRQTPVVICGMAGARQGWLEAPYVCAPCNPLHPGQAVQPETRDPRIGVRILTGVMQARPSDVMRGEETQISGYLASHPDFDGVLCLPGTHSKWVRVSGGCIQSFRTFMTGECFNLLATNSVLSHVVAGEGWNAPSFIAALKQTLSAPQHLTSQLFSIRASALLEGLDRAQSRSELSGILMGLEIGGAREFWEKSKTVLIGHDKLVQVYRSALEAVSAKVETADGEICTLDGLRRAYDSLKLRPVA